MTTYILMISLSAPLATYDNDMEIKRSCQINDLRKTCIAAINKSLHVLSSLSPPSITSIKHMHNAQCTVIEALAR